MINGVRMNTNLVKGILTVLLFTLITSCEFGAKSFAPESIGGMTFSFTVKEDPAEEEASQVGNIAICTFFKDGTYKLFGKKVIALLKEMRELKVDLNTEKGTIPMKKKRILRA